MPSSPHIHLHRTPNMAATLIQNESCLILLIKALYYTATLRENKNLDFVHLLCYFSVLKILVFVWLTGEAKLMLPFQNHSFFCFQNHRKSMASLTKSQCLCVRWFETNRTLFGHRSTPPPIVLSTIKNKAKRLGHCGCQKIRDNNMKE